MPPTTQQVSSDQEPATTSDNDEHIQLHLSWRSLFAFTTSQHTPSIACAGFATVTAGILKPIAAIFFGNIFSALTKFSKGNLSSQETLHHVSRWCIALTVLGVAAWFLEGSFLAAWMIFGELQAKSVREKMFTGMLDKEIEWYDLHKDGIGSLLIRIQTQIRELQLAVSQPLGFLLFELVGSLASLSTAFYFSWKLTLVIISVFPVAAVSLFLISFKLGLAVEAQKRELTQASKYANTAIIAIDTVKSFNGQDQEVWQYCSTIKNATAKYLIQARCNALQFGITKFIMVVIFVQGFWYGTVLVNNGMDPGRVLTTFYACLSAMQGVEVVLPQLLVLAKGMSAGQTLKSTTVGMQHIRNVTPIIGYVKPSFSHGDIEIKDVSFAYPANPTQKALNRASFFFPAGETTFIIGKSGSGKSTIGNLLMKYYEPLCGDILIDGQSIPTLEIGWLRQNVNLAQQQSVLFNETILQNIAFGRPTPATKRDIQKACYTADLEHTISELPEGFETIVGSTGRSLSGGQTQSISIARSRLRDAPILILDEPTSALDYSRRTRVMNAIRHWRKGKTTIIITHEMSHILDDDYVYVLERGMVVQEGYRQKLDETLPFEPSTNSRHPKVSDQRKTSMSSSSVFNEHREILDGHLSPRLQNIANFLGLQETTPSSLDKTISIRGSTQLSLGTASALANTLRAESIRSSPILGSTQGLTQSIGRLKSVTPHMSPKSSKQWSRPQSSSDTQKQVQVNIVSSAPPKSAHRPRFLPVDPTCRHAEVPNDTIKLGRKIESALEVRDSANNKPASLKIILSTVWPTLIWRDRLVLLLGFFAAFMVAAATPAFAIVFAKLLNVFNLVENQAVEARKWALSLLGIAAIDGFACYCTHYALEYCGQTWVNTLRVEALKRILNQPSSWFGEDRNSTSRLNECLDRNAEEMRNLIGRFAGLVFTVAWMLGISITWAFTISWKLTLVALACAPVMYVITRIFHCMSSKWEQKCNHASEAAACIFTETFSNIRVVRALTLENHFSQKYSKATSETYKIGQSRAVSSGLLFGLTDSVSFFVTAVVFYYGTVIICSGKLTVGTVIEVVNLLIFGIANASVMLSMIPQINSSRTTATDMLYLANLPRRGSEEEQSSKRLSSPFPIRMNSLSFTYPSQPSVPTLKNISLNVEANSCTAIVGSSGSGKSTIASILLGLYPPDPSIDSSCCSNHQVPPLTFAGTSILDCNVTSLRSMVAIVSQTTMLFPASVFENIAYGLPENSEMSTAAAVISAATSAGIHDFITSLPEGYSTQIGEGGQGLSGGQAQRIAIARALVRKPRLLILDEATSALDEESAEGIRETIRTLLDSRGVVGNGGNEVGIAVVIISHSQEMMRIARDIVVLEAGKVVERGTFEELKLRGGSFARLIGEESVLGTLDLEGPNKVNRIPTQFLGRRRDH